MLIYLAASYSRKEEINGYAEQLVQQPGFNVFSTWHDPKFVSDNPAKQCLHELSKCDAIIYFSGGNVSGGRHFELGCGYERQLELYCIGEPENIFHSLPEMKWFETFEKFLSFAIQNPEQF